MMFNKSLIPEIKEIIHQCRDRAIKMVDHERTLMYWCIGQRIFEEEQEGKDRAEYGRYLTQFIAEQLEPEYGSGFSKRQIELSRQFYRTFPIANTLYSQLNWSQYKLLLRIDNQDKRSFYIAESLKNKWTVRQLERQIYSNLWERLIMSNDKEAVLAVARDQKQPSDAKEIIKDPMYLEFLGLHREASYYEKDLEQAIITQKTHKLTHQDLGQLQMYVNYYDRCEKKHFENPTIGILLCARKNNAVVKISLPENNKTIIASEYKLYLPTEQQLMEEVKKVSIPPPHSHPASL